MIEPLELPFDQYQRYRLVAELLDEVRPRGKRWRVLDVGGRTGLLRAFLPKDRIDLVDVEASRESGLVLGSGAALPFADGSFDVVCAFDTLEHVPPRERRAFVEECARVAKTYAVIAGPYRSEEVDEAERLLQRFLSDKLGFAHRYLDEHRHHGLPDRAAVEKALAGAGAEVKSVGHGNLERWLLAMCLSMYADRRPELATIAPRFQRYYNELLFAVDHAPPVYRHAVVAAFGKAPLPEGRFLKAAPPTMAREARDLAVELLAFDRERDAIAPEWERLQAVNAGLEKDLREHRRALQECRDRRAELADVLGATERDLAGHRATLAQLAQERDAERARAAEARAALEGDLAQHAAALAAATKDLEGHRRVVAELEPRVDELAVEQRKLLALLETERAENAAVRAMLEKRLEDHRASLAELEQIRRDEAAALQRAQADLERDLAGHREVLAARDAELARLGDEAARLATDLAAARGAEARLGEDLEAHRAIVASLRGTETELRRDLEAALHGRNVAEQGLAASRDEAARAAAEIARLAAEVAALDARLRSRWDSLKRALGPKPVRRGPAA